MSKLGQLPLHTLLLLTERPARWPMGGLFPLAVAAAAGLGWLWSRTPGAAGLGLGLSLGLISCHAADWALLAALPRLDLSFGATQPPWLALVLVRSIAALAALPVVARWPLPGVAALALFQVLLWGLLAYGTLIEPFRLQVTRLDIASPTLSNPGQALRIVQLSDLHIERLTRRDRALPALVAGLEPDLIVLTGDFLNTSYNDDPRALADLHDLLTRFQAPLGLYAVWGTPEVDRPDLLRPVLARAGVRVLEDEAVALGPAEHSLWLVGLSATRDLDRAGVTLQGLLHSAPPGSVTVLLFHTPDLMPRAAGQGVDLVFSGHTHGGQWRLPGYGAILTSSVFGKRYEAGHHRQAGTHLYVSRGLGMEGFGAPRARFFCPPEVVAITLSGTGAPARG